MASTNPAPPANPAPEVSSTGGSLRLWGVLLLVLFLVTSTVGGSLALESSYLFVTLASHIGLALVTLGVSVYAVAFVGRAYRAVPQGFAGLAALSALGATIAGTVFLVGGQSNGALYAMEGLAGIGILASLVVIVVGGASGKIAPPKAGA
ncbi:MAG TPA: hypothetical protein VMG99_01495 [Thermoplasmata archaeon]|jgi:hypothetical protein|nr:hypothetical protein [Thermoplasmata archaeon]